MNYIKKQIHLPNPYKPCRVGGFLRGAVGESRPPYSLLSRAHCIFLILQCQLTPMSTETKKNYLWDH